MRAWPVLLLALALASCGGGSAAQPAGASASPQTVVACGSAMPAPKPLPEAYPPVQPPSRPLEAFVQDGYNWSAGYQLQSLVFHLMATHDPQWAARIVASADHLLAERNAPSPVDGLPYAWSMPSDAGYVWVGFVGHLFAPMMQFARTVIADPVLGACTVQGRTLRSYAASYLAEFDRAFLAHASELAGSGGESFYVFANPVPAGHRELQDTVLPVNMEADMFMAALHSVPVEAALVTPQAAQARKALVAGFVRYLQDRVLQHVRCAPARTCLRWNYSVLLSHADDIGHANVVAKFLLDAAQDGYGIPASDLAEFANTIDDLFDATGRPAGDLLDGSNIAGVASSVYYLILYGRISASVRAKMGHIVLGSHVFAYAGPWLEAQP